ncbi:MAG: ATP-dependent DNA helicase [Candidatus Thermoplasmatota archaeon]|nr:ATP-dependent DNA helicase [Candidatus Thermoplasmatota archaeon]
MENIKNALEQHTNIIFESGTGSGKTICTVASTLEFSLKNNKKIIYTTRTNAQQRQVIQELRSIRKFHSKNDEILGVGIQGRGNMCLLARNNPDFECGTSDELSRLCSYEKKKARSTDKKGEGCIYYKNFIDKNEKVEKILAWFKKTIPTVEEFILRCEEEQICPYELNKFLVQDAKIVVVPYIYIFNISIRNLLFDWLAVPEKDIILVVDEAHNLPEYIRELFSAQLSKFMLNNCLFEIEKFGDPSIAGGKFQVSQFCQTLLDIIIDLSDTYIHCIMEDGIKKNNLENKDAFLPSKEFEIEIMHRLNITSKTIDEIVGDLIAYGEKIQEYRQKSNKLPRSFLHKIGVFLEFWMNLDPKLYSKLIVDEEMGRNPRIEAYCLDPSIGTDIMKIFHATVHMSGTLEPIEEYRDSLGFSKDTTMVNYPSPFSSENRRVFYVKDTTTKYSELSKNEIMYQKMEEYIHSICKTFPRNTMVFFPSFNTLSQFRKRVDTSEFLSNLFVEEQKMSQCALMDLISEFKECGNDFENPATLFSVMGGRISEGMDFPAKQLEIAILVGIPYPKPSARQRSLQHYYDLKFRKGWEYTVEAPAARKLLQSIGRLIRDENDRGVAVILDNRAPRFKKYIKDLCLTKDIIYDIRSFMEFNPAVEED